MASLNSFDFTGRLGQDPRLAQTNNGTDVCNFSVAIDRWGDKEPVWVDVAVWGQGAAPCAQYLAKGSQVAVHGQIDGIETFDKRDGSTGTSLKVSSREVTFIGSKDDTPKSDVPNDTSPAMAGAAKTDDDIPF